jgi:hypothetical protein
VKGEEDKEEKKDGEREEKIEREEEKYSNQTRLEFDQCPYVLGVRV